jgi:hypothetical protein
MTCYQSIEKDKNIYHQITALADIEEQLNPGRILAC